MSFDVPILLCVFNRPELTSKVFDVIARHKPSHLLIAGDGPRSDRPDDDQLVQQTRRIVERVDWDCVVQARFAANNLGCRAQMAKAITWGFDQYEKLIILEDDCLPHDSFFEYCRGLLDRYENDERVMTVSGNTYETGELETSYRFSKYPLIWGWASWRRAWQHYDLGMNLWRNQEVQQRVLERFTGCPDEREYWRNIFDNQHAGNINTWDYSWTFSSWANDGLTILPGKNLVTNIGFGDAATHTFDPNSPMANRAVHPIEVTRHPAQVECDVEADRLIREIVFQPSPNPILPIKKSLISRLWDFSRQTFSTAQLSHNSKAA